MNNQTQNPAPNFESVWAALQETARLMRENEQRKEQLFEKQVAENEQRTRESEQRLRKNEQLFEKQVAENDRRRKESDKEWQDFHKSMKAMREELGGVGKSNGAVAESYFVNSFTNSMQFAGQEYDSMDHHCRRSSKKLNLKGEYDLVLYNCTSVVIIEVKYNARQKDIDRLLKKAPVFKQLFPQYVNFDFYLGLAAFHFEENTESNAMANGIAVIKQVGDNMVIYDEDLKVF